MTLTTRAASSPRSHRRRRRRGGSTAAPLTVAGPPTTAAPPPADPPTTAPAFAALGVPARIVAALAGAGIVDPFPIQTAVLPDALAGRHVLGRARTGSGKTIAFAIPTVAALAASGRQAQAGRPRALVLVPTRELALQVATATAPLASAVGLQVATVYGGVPQARQVAALRRGVDILVACPGRLEDLIAQGRCHLDAIEVTVIDEADHMADLGFLPPVRRLLDATPEGSQRLLFSATLDASVDVLVRRYLRNPATHSTEPATITDGTIVHHLLEVDPHQKRDVIRDLAAGDARRLFFTRTKYGARKLARRLTQDGVRAADLHGDLSQNVRERHLAAFATGSVKVLVATDIAARGIHIDDVALVVHIDPPAEQKAYLHRSGRTGRAGAAGAVVTLVTADQSAAVRAMARDAGVAPSFAQVTPGDARVAAVVRSADSAAPPARH